MIYKVQFILASDSVKPESTKQFQKEYQSMVLSIISNLKERSPLNYLIVRCVTALSPVEIASNGEASSLKIKKLIMKLALFKWMSSDEADRAISSMMHSSTRKWWSIGRSLRISISKFSQLATSWGAFFIRNWSTQSYRRWVKYQRIYMNINDIDPKSPFV